jgi:Mrp family chromosome partitioning ATPase
VENGTSPHPDARDWIQPPDEAQGIGRYVETLRDRLWIVVTCVVVATFFAILYVATATKQYEAEADLLITPRSQDTVPLVSLPLIQDSSDPTRPVETASRLVTNIDVAERVVDELGLDDTPRGALSQVTAEPVAQSNIVAITAKAPSPEEAQALANSFAKQTIIEQTATLHRTIDEALPALRQTAQQESPATAASPTSATSAVGALETLRASKDPTLRVQTEADLPTGPVSPRPALSLAAGLIGGLILGIGAAFAMQALDPRLRREEQLRRLYRIPILARIPKERGRGGKPLRPTDLSPPTAESYRTLRGLLGASRSRTGGRSRTILVTGSSPSEGKSTTAINLASSLAAAGHSVILVEADLRRPAISSALGLNPRHGVVSVLIQSVPLADALVPYSNFGPSLNLLLADGEGGWISELFALPAAREMLREAGEMADYVIIDSPPLTDVIDALPLATYADNVLIVSRIGKTDLRKLSQLGELLAENGIRPVGFAVVGTPRPKRSGYHYYAERRPPASLPRLSSAGRRSSSSRSSNN